ncbi:MAG: preprotein translocase subunit SecE [Eubacterium sp.]|jgi:preprotein translocase subunit SecE
MAANPQVSKKKRTSPKEYFAGVRKEMSKVVWPTRSELGAHTIAVLIVVAAFALVFWLVDLGVLASLGKLLGSTTIE